MRVYRLVKEAYAAQAFTGFRPNDSGGRWHRPGQTTVYTAGSLALAVLEVLVHLHHPRSLQGYVWLSLELPDAGIETPTALPDGWDARPYTAASVTYGSRWFAERRSVGLKVPSVIVPEPNVVINPAHPDFDPTQIEGPHPLAWDVRLR